MKKHLISGRCAGICLPWHVIAALAVFLMLAGSGYSGKLLTVSGSSTVKPIVEAAAVMFKETHPGVQVTVGGGGSSVGVKNVAAGNTLLGMASRSVKEKEMTAHPDLVPTTIGRDGVAIIVNKSNPLSGLSRSQVFDIYTGAVGNWEALGGSAGAIDPHGILLHHGTSSVFMKFFGLDAEERGEGVGKTVSYWKKEGVKGSACTAKGVDGNRPACAAVMTNPRAVSFASIGFAQSLAEKGAPVKLLKLDGVEATAANVVSGAYALSRPLLVITKGPAAGEAKGFIDLLLSSKGQGIVKDKGYIPVR